MKDEKKEIRFVDCFGGIGGFRLGLERADSRFRCVGYYEFNRHCVQVYNHQFKENHKPTDITAVKAKHIPDHDLFCGGFPCQSFSIAGKRKGFQDTRGTMFFEICRILKEKRPRLCLLENVRGLLSADNGRCFHTILLSLDELGYDAEWQILNTKHYLPQNRERVFIVGHLREDGGCSREVFPIRQDDKAVGKDGFVREGVEQIAQTLRSRDYANWQGNFVQLPDSKIAGCLSGGGHSGGLHSDMTVVSCLTPDRANKRQHGRRFKEVGEDMFTLTGQDVRGVKIQSHSPRCGNPKKGGTGLLESGEYCFTLDSSPHYVNLIRRLTPLECERLQGFPDQWTARGVDDWGEEAIISDSQRYKMLGNAVTVNVIEAVGRALQGVGE